jgi:hypothetical protein
LLVAGTLTCAYDYLAIAECFKSAQGGTNFLNGVSFPYAQGGSGNCQGFGGSSSSSTTGEFSCYACWVLALCSSCSEECHATLLTDDLKEQHAA